MNDVNSCDADFGAQVGDTIIPAELFCFKSKLAIVAHSDINLVDLGEYCSQSAQLLLQVLNSRT